MEFGGDAVGAMNMDERMTICNMVVEAGGKNGLVAPDQTTYDYGRARTDEPFEPEFTDAGARCVDNYRWDVSKLEPLVAAPHSPDNRKKARECSDVKVSACGRVRVCVWARVGVCVVGARGEGREREEGRVRPPAAGPGRGGELRSRLGYS